MLQNKPIGHLTYAMFTFLPRQVVISQVEGGDTFTHNQYMCMSNLPPHVIYILRRATDSQATGVEG